MEQALFSPPLSKQRVEYAVQHIKESGATTLVSKHFSSVNFLCWYVKFSWSLFYLQVDFGCGSGSLLDSLLNYPTALEKIVGVDISQKSLGRAAKVWTIYSCSVLHSFLIKSQNFLLSNGHSILGLLPSGVHNVRFSAKYLDYVQGYWFHCLIGQSNHWEPYEENVGPLLNVCVFVCVCVL